MVEVFKCIAGYENIYQISNCGRVKSLKKVVDRGKCHRVFDECILKPGIDKKGYLRCSLSHNGKSKTFKIHRLVAEAFIPNPENKPQVNHINGDKLNNNVSNLEWCDQSENMKHACKMGLKLLGGENNPASKLTAKDVEYIKTHYNASDENFNGVALSKKFGVNRKTISRIISGAAWKEGGVNVKNNIV